MAGVAEQNTSLSVFEELVSDGHLVALSGGQRDEKRSTTEIGYGVNRFDSRERPPRLELVGGDPGGPGYREGRGEEVRLSQAFTLIGGTGDTALIVDNHNHVLRVLEETMDGVGYTRLALGIPGVPAREDGRPSDTLFDFPYSGALLTHAHPTAQEVIAVGELDLSMLVNLPGYLQQEIAQTPARALMYLTAPVPVPFVFEDAAAIIGSPQRDLRIVAELSVTFSPVLFNADPTLEVGYVPFLGGIAAMALALWVGLTAGGSPESSIQRPIG